MTKPNISKRTLDNDKAQQTLDNDKAQHIKTDISNDKAQHTCIKTDIR